MQPFDKITCIHSTAQHSSSNLEYRMDISIDLVTLIVNEIRNTHESKVSFPVFKTYFWIQIWTLQLSFKSPLKRES